MATLLIQTATRAGVKPLQVAAAGGGDSFVNSGAELILIKNADASPKTLTIVTQATVDGLTVASRTVVIPAGEEWLIGPFPAGTYNDTNGKVNLTYSAVTSVTIAIVNPGH